MKVAFGLKAHSGWAALVVLGARGDGLQVIDRRRIELIEKSAASWARQPYHAAEHLEADEGRRMVGRGIAMARRVALSEIRAALKRARAEGHEPTACAVLVVDPMPAWTVAEILAVHFRMHKAEGVLFRDALALAAGKCGLGPLRIPEKQLDAGAQRALATPAAALRETITALGKSIGPPWGKDQKDAALAALIALRTRAISRS